MTKRSRKPAKISLIKNLYRTHGALTFLLAMYPLLPNMVELHTKGYLGLTRRLTGSVSDIEPIIRIMFGKRGLAVYEAYKQKHPRQIMANEIFEAIFETKEIERGLKLIQTMFFDRSQRNFVHADKMRSAIILTIPEILRAYPQTTHKNLRTKLIRLIANHAIIDQAIPSQLAFIETSLRLLTQIERHRLHLEQAKIQTMFTALEAKIKAELAGKASAFSAPPIRRREKLQDPIIITDEEAANLWEVLVLLAISPAVEVRNEAKAAIIEINKLKQQSGIPSHKSSLT